MRFSDLVKLLKDTKNKPYILESSRRGKKVAVAPSLVGRVMGCTASGNSGPVLGWINTLAIKKGPVDPVFNNYGGEERLWLSPEGGQFSLWFKPGAKQPLAPEMALAFFVCIGVFFSFFVLLLAVRYRLAVLDERTTRVMERATAF